MEKIFSKLFKRSKKKRKKLQEINLFPITPTTPHKKIDEREDLRNGKQRTDLYIAIEEKVEIYFPSPRPIKLKRKPSKRFPLYSYDQNGKLRKVSDHQPLINKES